MTGSGGFVAAAPMSIFAARFRIASHIITKCDFLTFIHITNIVSFSVTFWVRVTVRVRFR